MRAWQFGATALSFVMVSSLAHAGAFSFTGSFTNDTDLQYFSFTLANPTPGVELRTWSYAGGTNAAGTAIPAGGFEPTLNLYMADGTQMNPGISGPCSNGNSDPLANLSADPISGACADVFYPTTLSFPGGTWNAGTYIVVLSLFANPGIGNLSDGFFADQVLGQTPPANFTCQPGPLGYQGTPTTVGVDQPFCDEWLPNTERTGNWALDILNVDSASEGLPTAPGTPVPEPSSLALSLAGLAAIAGLVGRNKRRRA